jgi:endo-1,4-beta-xylanase
VSRIQYRASNMKIHYLIAIFLFIQAFTSFPVYAGEEGSLLEEKILQDADRDIEKYRKSDAVIEVVDEEGNPVPDALVHARQTTSDFLFACNVTLITGDLDGTIPIEHYRFQPRLKTEAQEEEFKKRFEELFNCATIPLYWASLEPAEGQPDYHAVDRVLEWCKSRGITVKGHTLVWVHGDNVPKWFASSPVDEQKKLLEKHVRDFVARYRGRMDMWDVVNEAAWANSTLAGMTMHDYTSLPFLWARESDPDAHLAINDAHKIIPLSEMERAYNLLIDLNSSDVPYNIIGVQAHVHHVDRFPLEIVLEMLRKYSQLGKPIHVTEFVPPSGGEPIQNSWKEGFWTEEEQAEYAEKFYRVCFSVPAVESIGWWDLTDYSAWVAGSGLLRADLSPKPSYTALKNLIHKTWRTETRGEANRNGLYRFRGFHGEYDVQIEDSSGKKTETTIHIWKGENNRFQIALPVKI